MAPKNTPHTYKNTAEWVPVFLAALRALPNVKKAADKAGVYKRRVYEYAEAHPEFKAEWDEIIKDHIDNIEGISFEQALDPSAQNTGMRIFLLKTWKRERYKETIQNEVSGPDGQALTINVVHVDAGPTDNDQPFLSGR